MFDVMRVIEFVAVAFLVVYLVLVIRRNVWCWPAGLVAALLSIVVFVSERLYMQTLLQVFYAGMSVYGWHQWLRGGEKGEGVAIGLWPARTHAAAIVLIVAASAGFAWILQFTNESVPLIDSFTTIGALVATYMVAKKILENWIYWFVIDSVSVYLYWSRGLVFYTAVFVLYLVLIVIGMRQWLAEWRRGGESAPEGAHV